MMCPAVLILSITQGLGHGAETVLENMLHAWTPRDFDLILSGPLGSRADTIAHTINLPWLPLVTPRDALVPNFHAIWRLQKQWPHQIALIHAWQMRAFELACWLGWKNSIPVLGTLHDHPQALFTGFLRRKILKYAANHFRHLVCVSKAVQHACLQNGFCCPLQVIYNGLIDVPLRSPGTSSNRRIGFVGMYALWKGFDIIESWISSTAQNNVSWLLYGDVRPELKERAVQLEQKYGRKVLIRGQQSSSTIFSEIDLLVHPSLGFDPLPTALIEAGRAGIPTLASDVGGASEIIIHGKTGYLFDVNRPADGLAFLAQLLDNPSQSQLLGTQARRIFEERFRVQRMVDEYATLWSSSLLAAESKNQ